jgi:NADPH2:quinone reductase
MKAVRIHTRGSTDVMQLEEIEQPTPGEGQVLIRASVAGVNYADIGQRQGNYPNLEPLPLTLGSEVAGTVVAHGPGVTTPTIGTRVVSLVTGGYAEYAVAPANEVVPIAENVSDAQATVIPIQGQTAYMLLDKAIRFQKGERLLVHAASGGVGSLAVQLAKTMGASMVIGTTTSPEKSDFLHSLGVEVIVNTKDAHWVEQVMQATQGQGVSAVLDSVGNGIGQQSIACLAPFGKMAVYGSLTNEVTPLITQMLIPKCQSIIGYNTLIQPLGDKMRASHALMQALSNGQLRVSLDDRFTLAQATEAHKQIEASKTHGKVVLKIQ